jgi:hypothetical protein
LHVDSIYVYSSSSEIFTHRYNTTYTLKTYIQQEQTESAVLKGVQETPYTKGGRKESNTFLTVGYYKMNDIAQHHSLGFLNEDITG